MRGLILRWAGLLAGLCAGLCVLPTAASACATCACGDPTLTLMGAGRTFAGRLRVGLELQGRQEQVARPGDLAYEDTVERRLTLGAAYAPVRQGQIALRLPWVSRAYTGASMSRDEVSHVGDLEIRGRWTVYEDRAFAPRHQLGVSVGLRAPTAPWIEGEDRPLTEEAQPGTGAWVPLAGLWYAWRAQPWSGWISLGGERPGEGWRGRRPGATALLSALFQYQLGGAVALTAGAEGRWSAADRVNGARDPDTGGTVWMATGGLVAQPVTDWLVHCTLRVPVIDAQAGDRQEGWMWLTGLTVDL